MTSAVEQFNALLSATNKPIFALFGAEAWCKPCKMVGPIFEKMSENNTDIVFVKIDIEHTPDLSLKYNITTMPSLLVIVNKEIKDSIFGLFNEHKLQQIVRKYTI